MLSAFCGEGSGTSWEREKWERQSQGKVEIGITRTPHSTTTAPARFSSGCSSGSFRATAPAPSRRSIVAGHIYLQLLAFSSTVAHITARARTAIGVAARTRAAGALGRNARRLARKRRLRCGGGRREGWCAGARRWLESTICLGLGLR